MIDLIGLIPVLASLATGGLSIYIWQRRSVPGARAFSIFSAAVTVWCFFTIFEYYSLNLLPRITFGKLQYIGIAVLPVTWLLFTLRYTRRGGWLRLSNIATLSFIPILTLILAASNRYHGLIWRSVDLRLVPYPHLVIDHGLWFNYVFSPYSYLLFALGIGILLASFFADSSLYRKQTGIVLLSIAAPLIANVLYLMSDTLLGGLDPTPYAFAVCVGLNAYGLFGRDQVHVTPVSYRALFLNTAEAVILLNSKSMIIDINPAALNDLDQSKTDVLGKSFCTLYPQCESIIPKAQQNQVANTLEVVDENDIKYLEVKARPIFDNKGDLHARLVIMRDVTAEQEQQARLEQFAYIDSLTGVANRRQLARETNRAFGLAGRYNLPLSLLYLDLDRFKMINDNYGHEIGDAVLVHVAQCLQNAMRENDVVARLGGDEFAVLLYDADRSKGDDARERLRRTLNEPFYLANYHLSVDVSIGMALYPQHGSTLEELLREADRCMYRRKQSKSSRLSTTRPRHTLEASDQLADKPDSLQNS